MRSKLSLVFALTAAAAITFGGVGTVMAATIGVSSVTGSWTATPQNGPTYVADLSSSAVSWGTPFYSPTGLQSGYTFAGAAAGVLTIGQDFNLGTFTHNNFVINKGTSITAANLSVMIKLAIGTTTQLVTTAFNFDHWETDNVPASGPCANGLANFAGKNIAGCADRVRILNNTSSNQIIVIGGLQYILEITGFTVVGQFFSEFWTAENASNSAILRARFTQYCPDGVCGGANEPIPPPVPLPAAGWLMLAGLGALTAARACRKA